MDRLYDSFSGYDKTGGLITLETNVTRRMPLPEPPKDGGVEDDT